MSLSLKQKSFVNAYLGEANGNATKAAIIAGYSERTAYAQGSRLLKHVEVQQALQRQLTKVGLTEDQAIEELGELATRHVDKVSAADKIRALELFLKVKGSFAPEKPQVTEKHYYFGSLEALLALRRDSTPTASSQVMAQPALVLPALPEAIPGEIVG
jgi:hypothetical protein